MSDGNTEFIWVFNGIGASQSYFKPNSEEQTEAAFIQRFSNAAQEHYHYENDVDGGMDDL